jgi:hypothetical protein
MIKICGDWWLRTCKISLDIFLAILIVSFEQYLMFSDPGNLYPEPNIFCILVLGISGDHIRPFMPGCNGYGNIADRNFYLF